MELVTIGITSFNAESTIIRAIECAINQDYQNYEIIVVDDCSTDTTTKLINEYFKKINNSLRYKLFVHDCNKGPAASRNTIISNSKGEFIIFFDDDDYSYNNRVRTQIKLLKETQKKIKSDKLFCFASGKKIYNSNYNYSFKAIGSIHIFPPGDYLLDFLTHNKKVNNIDYGSGTPACSLMALKKTFLDIGMFDEKLRRVEDADISIRLTLDGGYLIGTKQILFEQFYSIGNDKSPIMNYNSEVSIIEKNKIKLKRKSMYIYSKYWTKLRYFYFQKKYINCITILIVIILINPIYCFSHVRKTFYRRFMHDKKIAKNEN